MPVGSVAKENLVTLLIGAARSCPEDHGLHHLPRSDLKGIADVPPIAGRSPSYIARQLYDIQQGTRNGVSAPLMKPVVASLSADDIVAIAAYVGGR